MDHFSMMNLQVRKGTLSNEMLSILEEDFGFQEKTQTLLDSMLVIINPKDEVGLKYATKLAELRQQQITQVDHSAENVTGSIIESNPVDIVFHKLFINYAEKFEEDSLKALKEIFTKDEFFDEIFSILINEIESVKLNGVVDDQLFKKMDVLIEKTSNHEIDN